ncbi:MAG TPA: methionyl-tRNA formyltransferase [Polyangia bacterium]|nr:methionyl-tRNA formyltransferase [Polyangia bacterium]
MTIGRPRAVFFGSPTFAVPSLRVAAAETRLCAVVSQPDRPAGRGRASSAPAVKLAAQALGVPIFQPEKVRTPETLATLAAFEADIFIVVAYGRILPQTLLDLPRLGAFNVHASLLPKLRGAAPIQWAIINGEHETGVSIMRMEAGLDTGPVAARRGLPIADDDTAGTLSIKLAELGAQLLGETLPAIVGGALALTPQNEAAHTLAPLLSKTDGRLDFGQPARRVSAQARGVDPWPGATALLDGEVVRLFEPIVLPPAPGGAGRDPGVVLGLGEVAGADHGAPTSVLAIACGDSDGTSIGFAELQLPGRRRLPVAAVLAGRPIPAGTRLDS